MSLPLWAGILASLLSLAIALWLDWPPATLLFLFWIENIVLAIWQLPRFFLANGREGVMNRLFTSLFFLIHFGLFTLVHGILVFDLFLHQEMTLDSLVAQLSAPGIGLAVAGLFISRGIGFFEEFARGELTQQRLPQVMKQPYRHIVVLHLVLLTSGFLLNLFPWPTLAVALLIGIRIIMEITAERKNVAQLNAATD